MLERLNSAFKIVSRSPPSPHGLKRLRDQFGSLPLEVEALHRETGEIEVLGPTPRYFRLWSPEGCVEMNAAYGITDSIPDGVPIGDDGGGHVILVMPTGIFRNSLGVLSTAIEGVHLFLAPSLGAFLAGPEALWPPNEL